MQGYCNRAPTIPNHQMLKFWLKAVKGLIHAQKAAGFDTPVLKCNTLPILMH